MCQIVNGERIQEEDFHKYCRKCRTATDCEIVEPGQGFWRIACMDCLYIFEINAYTGAVLPEGEF